MNVAQKTRPPLVEGWMGGENPAMYSGEKEPVVPWSVGIISRTREPKMNVAKKMQHPSLVA